MSNRIRILDCTLRDGGYVNNWNFGRSRILDICKDLSDAKVDIIEIGFLTDKEHTNEQSLYTNSSEVVDIVKFKENSLIAVMIALGEKESDPSKLSTSKETGIDIVRITFHNNESEVSRAIEYANILMNKGYKVCMQPVGTTTYTDEELLNLINKINELKPFAFYLVDTLGTLYRESLLKFVKLIDDNLDIDIRLGFHSHNNLQMSFSNNQLLAEYDTRRNIILDSSLYGMGRGAGNLCTELIARYLNETANGNYLLVNILDAIDNHIYPLSLDFQWGYNAHYYMSAIYNCHPNYSSYLMNKQTLTMEEINILLQNLPKEKRHLFNKELIENLYLNFQLEPKVEGKLTDMQYAFKDKEVLLLAPGHTITQYEDKIKDFIAEKKPIVVAINVNPKSYFIDYLFISNRKRLLSCEFDKVGGDVIITSNLPKLTNDYIVADYDILIDNDFDQPDNAGMMMIRLLINSGVKKVYLAGFDGFTSGKVDNYFESNIADHNTKDLANDKTLDVEKQINKLSNIVDIEFITPSLYKR